MVALVVAHLDEQFGQGVDGRHVAHRHLRVFGRLVVAALAVDDIHVDVLARGTHQIAGTDVGQ